MGLVAFAAVEAELNTAGGVVVGLVEESSVGEVLDLCWLFVDEVEVEFIKEWTEVTDR